MRLCRSCGAPIEWARTELGRPIPLDVGVVEGGNLTVIKGVARARTSEDAQLLRAPRRSHFVSCPQADAWRKS